MPRGQMGWAWQKLRWNFKCQYRHLCSYWKMLACWSPRLRLQKSRILSKWLRTIEIASYWRFAHQTGKGQSRWGRHAIIKCQLTNGKAQISFKFGKVSLLQRVLQPGRKAISRLTEGLRKRFQQKDKLKNHIWSDFEIERFEEHSWSKVPHRLECARKMVENPH